MNRKQLSKTLSILVLIALWQIISMIIGTEFVLASPFAVVKRLFEVLLEPDFLETTAYSFLRIGAGFFAAFFLAFLLAIAANRFHFVESFLWPYVAIIKAVPVASFIILFLIWMDYSAMTIFITFLISFPMIYSNVLSGMKNADQRLLEVASLYHIPFGRAFLYIYLPSVKPFLLSSCEVAIGMAWKAGIAAEVIGIVDGSIGEKLQRAKIYFQNADLLAWTIVIIVVSVLSEKVFSLILKQIFRGIEKL